MAHDRSTNQGFPLLQQGDEIDNWGDVVRTEAFVPLEERLMVVDTSANRSNYVSYADLLYYETDTGKLYEGDGEGSGWSETQLESRLSTVETNITGKASNPHGNSAHSETFAVDGDTQPPENHGDGAHTESYAKSGDNVEEFSTTGSSGTVPTSQGDGTLAMETVGVDDLGNVLGGNSGDSTAAAVHPDSDAGGDGSVAVGDNSTAAGSGSIAIGNGAINDHDDAIIIGNNATADTAFGASSVVVGNSASATSSDAVAIGRQATADGSGVALGENTTASDFNAVAIGVGAEAANTGEAVLGGTSESTDTYDWVVPGDFTVNGSKNFEIPDPSRPDTHDLRHGNYEGDVAGGLIYRREVSITTDGETGTATVTMPDWFGPLATDVDVVVQAQGHFGDAYAEREEPTGETITVTANASGDYKLVIFATRDDANVPDPVDHDVTKPKGLRWNGEPRTYYLERDDGSAYSDVERIETKFDHDGDCKDTPCESAAHTHRVTFTGGDRVDVLEGEASLDDTFDTIIELARDHLEGN